MSSAVHVSSGELLFRIKSVSRDSWLGGSIGPDLHEFLNDNVAEEGYQKSSEEALSKLDEIEQASLLHHQSHCRMLRTLILQAEQTCKSFLTRAKLTANESCNAFQQLLRRYDENVAQLALMHYATLERERDVYNRRLEEETQSCERLRHQVKESLRLSVFSIHLESETDGQVILRRLPTAHPQHVRCRRAASENIKPGYFDQLGGFSGINVLDVYKVENKPLLQQFQRCAASMEPGKVKGLFTSVPASCIERIIALGMGRVNTISGDLDNDNGKQLFRRAWYAFHNRSATGYAESRVKQSDHCVFPRSFSRYSTLDVDRDSIQDAAAGNTTAAPQITTGASDGGGEGGGPINEQIRYLVLCRVAIGRVFVTSKEYKGFPAVGRDPAFDSMYNPLQEEYLVLHANQVLPEFVVQYVFKHAPGNAAHSSPSSPTAKEMGVGQVTNGVSGRKSPSGVATHHGTVNPAVATPLVPTDLSVPTVTIPSTLTQCAPELEKTGTRLIQGAPNVDGEQQSSKFTPAAFVPHHGALSCLPTTDSEPMSLPSNSLAAASAVAREVKLQEQLTSWEQLRLNGARQRESVLDSVSKLLERMRQAHGRVKVSSPPPPPRLPANTSLDLSSNRRTSLKFPCSDPFYLLQHISKNITIT